MSLIQFDFAAASRIRWTDVTAIIPIENAGMPVKEKPAKFKTLYLLHGFSGNSKDWLTYSNIRALAEENNLAVIMPSGENGFYVDNPEFELKESEFIRELVEHTRKLFPLSEKREDTFIGGLSMGGFGALENGAVYGEIFGKAFSLSGAFIINDIAGKQKGYRDPMAGYGYYRRVFGDLTSVKERKVNPLVAIQAAWKKGSLPKLFIACGTEDFTIEKNRELYHALKEAGIPISYHEGNGTHNWKFWNEWLPKAIEFLEENEK